MLFKRFGWRRAEIVTSIGKLLATAQQQAFKARLLLERGLGKQITNRLVQAKGNEKTFHPYVGNLSIMLSDTSTIWACQWQKQTLLEGVHQQALALKDYHAAISRITAASFSLNSGPFSNILVRISTPWPTIIFKIQVVWSRLKSHRISFKCLNLNVSNRLVYLKLSDHFNIHCHSNIMIKNKN